MSRHVVPPSKKTDRGEIPFFVIAVDRRLGRAMIEIPVYNARLIFTTDLTRRRKVKIWQDKDRQPIDPKAGKATLNVSDEVYKHVAKVAASILGRKRSSAEA